MADSRIVLPCGCVGVASTVDGVRVLNFTPCSTACWTVRMLLEKCDTNGTPVVIRENGKTLG